MAASLVLLAALTLASSYPVVLLASAATPLSVPSYSSAASPTIDATTELKLVQVVTRHGARTPYKALPAHVETEWECSLRHLSVPSDLPGAYFEAPRLYRKNYIQAREILPGNCMQGQLTQQGYLLHFALGESFRKYYVDQLGFLSTDGYPSSEHIYVRSTDVPRTVASAEAQLLGFFPRKAGSIHSQVVDINVIDHGNENMSPGNRCPKMIQQCNAAQNTAAWQQRLATWIATSTKLATAWNVSQTEVGYVDDLWDNLYARSFHNIQMPPGVDATTFEAIRDLSAFTFENTYTYSNVAKLGIGVFLGEIMAGFEANLRNQSDLKWIYYSGHDTTVGLLLAAFDALQGRGWPDYASHIELELRTSKTNGQAFVRFMYQGKAIVLPGCNGEELCPFEVFSKIAGKATMTEAQWQTECQSTGPIDPVGWVSSFLC